MNTLILFGPSTQGVGISLHKPKGKKIKIKPSRLSKAYIKGLKQMLGRDLKKYGLPKI